MEENNIKIFIDYDEWCEWGEKGDFVMYIELVKWVDVFVLALFSVNILVKIVNGLCDNFFMCVFCVWDFKDFVKCVFIVFVMNIKMWESSFIERYLRSAREFGVVVVSLIEKYFVCGDFGVGVMVEVFIIVEVVWLFLV